MRVLIVEPGTVPYLKEIEDTLEAEQEIVDGLIQVTYPFDDEVAIVCNDEGKLLGLPLNRGLYSEGKLYDIIAGTFMVCGLSEYDLASIDDKNAMKFYEVFKYPELVIPYGLQGEIVAFRFATEDTLKELNGQLVSEIVNDDILKDLGYDMMNIKSIIDCHEDLNDEKHHVKEVDKILERISSDKDFEGAVGVKICNLDKDQIGYEPEYILMPDSSEAIELINSLDIKNGCDIGISHDGGIAFALYGSNYGLGNLHKTLVTIHSIYQEINFTTPIRENMFINQQIKDKTKYLNELKKSIQSMSITSAKKRNREDRGL